jgi:aminoglycoside/choline kinase family phosphotransferase
VSDLQTTAGADTRARIDAYLTATGFAGRRPRVVPLTGDASDRRYFRVLLDESDSIVLALHAGPIDFATMAFANVAELLRRMEIPAPAVLGHSDPLGIIALQDLGDVTLQAHVGAASVTAHAALYREAVALIHQLQERGRALASPDFVPYTLAFDVEKLTWELDFFGRHFLEGYRGVSLSATERAALAEEWAAIAGELAAEPRVVCHRDYHSRNLMLHRGSLYMIDFQDARLGPDTYDLVSLLRDSYVDVTERELDDLIAYFLALAGGTDAAEFRRRFDLMAVQRNLKALGTFGFQAAARGNATYIQYMPRTLHSVRSNLERHGRFARLRDLLGAHLEELR